MTHIIQIDLNKLFLFTSHQADTVRIGVALSGGRDSVALAHLLKMGGYNIVAINVEHGIRGEKSVEDSNFVKELCEKWDIPLYAYSVKALDFAQENGYTVEQAARILRYQIFDKVIEEKKCDYVALAHHMDDQAETMLMHILRGTGVKGLVGMRKIKGSYIRPLLDYTREDINAYVEQNGLEYVEDETNCDMAYTRNFLRGELEILKDRYQDLQTSFARLSAIAEETEDYLDSQTPNVTFVGNEVFVKIAEDLHPVIEKRMYFKAIGMLGVTQDIENKHYELLLSLKRAQNGKRIELSHGIVAHKQEGYIVFTKAEELLKIEDMFFNVANLEWLGYDADVFEIDKFKKVENALFFDLDKVPKDAVLRSRKDGDFIEKFGGGTKSLGDFFTDRKIPLRDRDKLILLASGSEVLVVFGVEISKKLAITADTKRVCVVKK